MLYTQAELTQAQANRQRVSQGYCNSFYSQQQAICNGWEFGELPPRDLVLGTLPTIYKFTITHEYRSNEVNREVDND